MTYAVRYGPGTSRTWETRPGDIVLTHRRALPSRAIALGQRLRFRGADRPYAHWSHVACVSGYHGQLVEALGHGVEETYLSRYRDVEYHYVRTDATLDDRLQMKAFLRACVGRPYGYLEIASLGLALLTGGSRFAFGSPGTLICSALAAQMLCRGDYIFERDPNRAMPADVAKLLGVLP